MIQRWIDELTRQRGAVDELRASMLETIKRMECSIEMPLPPKAAVTVNGVRLTHGQSMTLRVAMENFAMDLQSELKDEIGEIGPLYMERIRELRRLMGKYILAESSHRRDDEVCLG